MIDLYRRLNVSPDSDAASVDAALPHADPATREAAQMILLNQRRRAVYDRNRQVLVTIGQLRARLGINYSRFWSRALYGDFVVDLESEASGPPPRLRQRVDPMGILRAFGPRRGTRHHHRRRRRAWVVAAVIAAAIFVAWLAICRYL